jgi:hypothetical protein
VESSSGQSLDHPSPPSRGPGQRPARPGPVRSSLGSPEAPVDLTPLPAGSAALRRCKKLVGFLAGYQSARLARWPPDQSINCCSCFAVYGWIKNGRCSQTSGIVSAGCWSSSSTWRMSLTASPNFSLSTRSMPIFIVVVDCHTLLDDVTTEHTNYYKFWIDIWPTNYARSNRFGSPSSLREITPSSTDATVTSPPSAMR